MFRRLKSAAANETEVRHELLAFSGVGAAPVTSAAEFPRDGARDALGEVALAEAIKADPKDGSKDATAWDRMVFVDHAQSDAFAVAAVGTSQPDRVGAIPMHERECPSGTLYPLNTVGSLVFNSFFHCTSTKKNVNHFKPDCFRLVLRRGGLCTS